MKIKNKFTLAENPQARNDETFIIHHQQPIAHIRVWHEYVSFDNSIFHSTFNYQGPSLEIETITFEITHCFFAGKLIADDEAKKRVNKMLDDARNWYCAYLQWEDNNILDEE